ncbi:Carbamoyl-phosphate synthase large chain [hydrothermal vent metagenome]|uniref:Carbamoyl phosphate synthase arginine-specific large chain, chloroplastic n=1 Tax=hydrothermal vent metagenome TaxID=652676 RepID=A0A3B1C9M8_9ZZZZ
MPKRTDINKILIIGAGPIVIGQACEFDYSGTQACKALKEEGFEVCLVNSNPATIMTDPEMADRTYIEPLTKDSVAKIIERERPDAILPTVGGQTALNIAVELAEAGVLEKYGVELIGAKLDAIKKAEDRELFKEAMLKIGLQVPQSALAHNIEEARDALQTIGLPAIIRPAFTLGGFGGHVAVTEKEYEEYCRFGISASPVSQILVERSIAGWKEFELEVMRDLNDNVVIICSIENLDPMGIHTGDSITVAPAQTLTDREYQIMRDASLAIIREIGVDTGGSNIQFALNPDDGQLMIIEMNPRVSRSSALASKATGFPIAKIAAKLAIGYTLDEIRNDITQVTPASFEPSIDYCVVKIPRFAFEKFPKADNLLGSQMKSVGEVMSIGRTFKESLQKAIRSLEVGSFGFDEIGRVTNEQIEKELANPSSERLWHVGEALRRGWTIERVHGITKIDLWFLHNIKEIIDTEMEIANNGIADDERLRELKALGFADRRLATLTKTAEKEIRRRRLSANIKPVFKRVDTCAAEFEALTPYLYSTYEEECESEPTDRKKIMILGGGPNRIGQGIEFDYCCVHGALGLKKDGYETIMVNCNPETVSTDYDTSDRLYFEPLTFEDVMSIIDIEKPYGIIVQFGGQTPLNLARALEEAGAPIIGTSPDSIDRAEDRESFKALLDKLGLKQPSNGTVTSSAEALKVAARISYPVVVRPSYVLGGRAMEIVYDDEALSYYMLNAVKASPDHPVLIDKFLNAATELDVDAICDGETVVIGGVMEHIEEAGVHSGDSACSLPPRSISDELLEEVKRQTKELALELETIGLINIQFAIQENEIFVLEVNPRASRTAPFVSKTIGLPLPQLAARVMGGKKLSELGFTEEAKYTHVAVKESVFPFIKFPNVDTVLGPEMKSTGEVMGLDLTFGRSFNKASMAAGYNLPVSGAAFISVIDADKKRAVEVARRLSSLGFSLMATSGTATALQEAGLDVEFVHKVGEGTPTSVEMIAEEKVDLVINTTFGKKSLQDSYTIRRTALTKNVPYQTTIEGAEATVTAIESSKKGDMQVMSLQEYFETPAK